ncbi:hypothetical protein Tco_0638997 [Tanacetum coccineum]
MAEELDEQQRQQVMLDDALVPINEQVKILASNYRIALEKIKTDVIYKVCLDILKQYSFYNAFIATTDALEIYMQQFWYTITQELSTQKYYFTMGDQVIEVNADLLYNALSVTPKDLDHPFTPPSFKKEIIRFINELGWKASAYDHPRLLMLQLWGMVTGSNIDFVELIWEDFKHQIRTRKDSKQNQELMPYPRFTKLIIKYVMSKNDKILKRPLSFQHANKGTIDPVFGMEIPEVMLNDDIKKGVEIAVERLRIPKRRRSKTVTEEVYESEKIDDLGDSEETKEEVVPLVRQRSTGVVIAQLKLDIKKAQKPRKEDFYIQQHSKGLGEGSDITLEVPDELVYKSLNEGAGVNPKVQDESNSCSSSLSSDSEVAVKDISSDEEKVTKKADNAKSTDVKKDTKDQVADEEVAKK